MRPVIVLAGSELPTEMMGLKELKRREYSRESVLEFRFSAADPWPKIPIRRDGAIKLARWGNSGGRSRALPRAKLTRLERVDAGEWSRYGAEPVEIAATFWCANGAWCFVREGIRGILVPDEAARAVCYVVCEPATNSFKNMTGCKWMPVLINQRY
jgi:hypothetical protein